MHVLTNNMERSQDIETLYWHPLGYIILIIILHTNSMCFTSPTPHACFSLYIHIYTYIYVYTKPCIILFLGAYTLYLQVHINFNFYESLLALHTFWNRLSEKDGQISLLKCGVGMYEGSHYFSHSSLNCKSNYISMLSFCYAKVLVLPISPFGCKY